jgi:hypothetical protein
MQHKSQAKQSTQSQVKPSETNHEPNHHNIIAFFFPNRQPGVHPMSSSHCLVCEAKRNNGKQNVTTEC